MKKTIIILLISIFLISIFLISAISAICCEKTVSGAWCQDVINEDECETGDYCGTDEEQSTCRSVPTSSCEATSYCKLGCCYNSQEGTCSENTPQKVCNDNGGVWSGESAKCDIPQCSLGCCLIGDQTAFVTQTRCKKLSSLYGLETNFRTDISNEIECIASANPSVKGACVFEEEFEKTCLMITKKECKEMESSASNVSFHEGYLCSAESLGTNCGPKGGTTCVEGKDGVYFLDTCGNLANIYDSLKMNNPSYWEKIIGKANSCGSDSSNANNPGCGNCDYFLGSTCKEYKKGQDAKPTYGDNICRDLGCKYQGKNYQHGESWCATVSSTNKESKIVVSENWDPSIYNKPGSRYFRLICYDNEVIVEPCADFRQEVCLQSDIEGFKTAACRVNMWQDCVVQDNEQDCENIDKRDCKWINSKCVPSYAPGFDFWNSEGDAESFCSIANVNITVKYEEKIGEDKKCVGSSCDFVTDTGNGNYVVSESWINNMNKICTSLGDCGSKVNYIGVKGYESKQAVAIG